jgi:flagellar basal-body rod protein FlgG
MAITALNTAATGLRALSTRIDVVANNLANAESTGFKRSRVNFEDLMYNTLRQPGTLNAAQEVTPAGIQVGLGVRISNTQLDMEQGSLERTDNPLDVAIQGKGFFRVQVADGVGDGTAYTRNGNFFVNRDGELVVGNIDGNRLEPSITFPQNWREVTIASDGTISVLLPGQVAPQTIGQLQLFNFVNPQGLTQIGSNQFLESPASGPAVQTTPGSEGTGKIAQGNLEASNVDPVKELVTLIKTQRTFELNSQAIQSADQALQTIGNLRRF